MRRSSFMGMGPVWSHRILCLKGPGTWFNALLSLFWNLNNLWANGPIFSLCTMSHKLCSCSWIRDSSVLWCVSVIHSPLLLSSIPLYGWLYWKCYSFLFRSLGFLPVIIEHLWKFVGNCFYKDILSFFLDKYLGAELLGHMVDVCLIL